MWNGVTFCCGQVGTWGNLCVAAQSAASHPQAVLWVSPCPTQPWGLCVAQGVGTWGCVAAWDTHGQGSATCSLHCKGVAAAARDMLSPQDVLMCSDPCPSPLPIPQACSFDLHPALFFFVWGCFFHRNLISTL